MGNKMKSTGSRPGTTLRVVDDDPWLRDVCASFLDGEGYTVLLAASRANALVLAARDPPQRILTDAALPGMDGTAALRGAWRP
jgi:two-component system OmpR family response regulator